MKNLDHKDEKILKEFYTSENMLKINPFIPVFLKWTLRLLNLDLSTDANRAFCLKSKPEWQTV